MVEKPSPAILASIRTAQSQAFLEMYLVESGSLPDQFIVSLLGALSIHHFFLKRVCNAECRVPGVDDDGLFCAFTPFVTRFAQSRQTRRGCMLVIVWLKNRSSSGAYFLVSATVFYMPGC